MSSRDQMLAIPSAIREEVFDRDGGLCRLCGRTDVIAHHIRYGGDAVGMGGRRFHHVDNIVSLGQLYQHRCHDVVHAAKSLWQPVLEVVLTLPGVTGLQVVRWIVKGAPGVDLGLPDELVERVLRARRVPTAHQAQ